MTDLVLLATGPAVAKEVLVPTRAQLPAEKIRRHREEASASARSVGRMPNVAAVFVETKAFVRNLMVVPMALMVMVAERMELTQMVPVSRLMARMAPHVKLIKIVIRMFASTESVRGPNEMERVVTRLTIV